jgi:hypothetical protein
MKLPGIRRVVRAVSLPLFVLAASLAPTAPVLAQTNTSQTSPAPVEQGKFILHKFEQPIGEETYEVSKDGDSLNVKNGFQVYRPRIARSDDRFFSRRGGFDAGIIRNQRQEFAQHDN